MKSFSSNTTTDGPFMELSEYEKRQLDAVFEIAVCRTMQELARHPEFSNALTELEDLHEKVLYILDGRNLQ